MEKPIRITITDHGSRGELTVGGVDFSVRSVQINVVGHDETLVTLVIPARYCDITYNARFGLDDNNR